MCIYRFICLSVTVCAFVCLHVDDAMPLLFRIVKFINRCCHIPGGKVSFVIDSCSYGALAHICSEQRIAIYNFFLFSKHNLKVLLSVTPQLIILHLKITTFQLKHVI